MPIHAPVILSINVGLPRDFGVPAGDGAPGDDDPLMRPWRSAIIKEPVSGPIRLGKTNLAGDAQADLRVHGGLEMAVLGYSADHYPFWRARLRMPDLPYGAFGENFTISGLDETTVCIGDTYAIGPARVQVSMPRGPCANLARRWGITDLVERVHEAGWAGWYYRVLAEGEITAGSVMVLEDRPCPQWSISQANVIRSSRREQPKAAAELAACPLLAESWRAKLA